MNTAIINIKTDSLVKKRAQKRAKQLGLSLSGVINSHLREFIASKNFHAELGREEPSEWLKQELKASREDEKAGRVSPGFDNAEDAIAWLNDKRR